MATKLSSKLATWRPSYLLEYVLPAYPQTCSITSSKFAQSMPPGVNLQTHSITTPECISNLARLPPLILHNYGLQMLLLSRLIMISECISKFTPSQPPSVYPNILEYRPQVNLQSRSIRALECISNVTFSSSSGTPRIALSHRLQAILIYCV